MPPTDPLRRAVKELEAIPECYGTDGGDTDTCCGMLCAACAQRRAAFPTLLAMVAQVARLDPTARLGVDTRTLWTNAAVDSIQKMMAAHLEEK